MVNIWDFVTSHIGASRPNDNTVQLSHDKDNVIITCPDDYDFIEVSKITKTVSSATKATIIEKSDTRKDRRKILTGQFMSITNTEHHKEDNKYIKNRDITLSLLLSRRMDQKDDETGDVIEGNVETPDPVEPPATKEEKEEKEEKDKEERFMKMAQIAIGVIGLIATIVTIFFAWKHYQGTKKKKSGGDAPPPTGGTE